MGALSFYLCASWANFPFPLRWALFLLPRVGSLSFCPFLFLTVCRHGPFSFCLGLGPFPFAVMGPFPFAVMGPFLLPRVRSLSFCRHGPFSFCRRGPFSFSTLCPPLPLSTLCPFPFPICPPFPVADEPHFLPTLSRCRRAPSRSSARRFALGFPGSCPPPSPLPCRGRALRRPLPGGSFASPMRGFGGVLIFLLK
jgi:hypothetical protein